MQGRQFFSLELLEAVFKAPCPRCPSGVQLPEPAARDAAQALPWTSVNFWLGFLALQGLQPSVTREWSNLAWQTGPREGNLKMSFFSFFAFLSCPACPATASRYDYGPNCWTKSWIWHVSKSQDFPPLQFSVCRFDFWGWFPWNNFQLHSIIFSQKYFLFSKAVKQDTVPQLSMALLESQPGYFPTGQVCLTSIFLKRQKRFILVSFLHWSRYSWIRKLCTGN